MYKIKGRKMDIHFRTLAQKEYWEGEYTCPFPQFYVSGQFPWAPFSLPFSIFASNGKFSLFPLAKKEIGTNLLPLGIYSFMFGQIGRMEGNCALRAFFLFLFSRRKQAFHHLQLFQLALCEKENFWLQAKNGQNSQNVFLCLSSNKKGERDFDGFEGPYNWFLCPF